VNACNDAIIIMTRVGMESYSFLHIHVCKPRFNIVSAKSDVGASIIKLLAFVAYSTIEDQEASNNCHS